MQKVKKLNESLKFSPLKLCLTVFLRLNENDTSDFAECHFGFINEIQVSCLTNMCTVHFYVMRRRGGCVSIK